MKILSNITLTGPPEYQFKTFTNYIPDLTYHIKRVNALKYISLNELFKHIPQEEYPDILVFASPEYLPVPEDISCFSGPKVLILTDWNVCIRYVEELCALFDFCFTDFTGVKTIRSFGVSNIFHQPFFGHSPEIFHLLSGGDRNINERPFDISFCGNLNPNLHRRRNQALYKLSRLSSKFSVYIGQVFGEDYVGLLNQSKLVWNFSIRSEANMRTYESMACGAIPLIEADNCEVPLYFEPDKHYIPYTLDNLESVIQSILLDPEKLIHMQKQALSAVSKQTKSLQITSMLKKVIGDTGQFLSPSVDTYSSSHPPSRPQIYKTLVKNNFLTDGYSHTELVTTLSPKWTDLPELEGEMMPGLILHKLFECAKSGQPTASFENVLNLRYFNKHFSYLPQVLRHYFQSQLFMVKKDYQSCLHHTTRCIDLLRILMHDKNMCPLRQNLYKFLIPPLDLSADVTVDLNMSYVNDRQSQDYKTICQLLIDNCLSREVASHLCLHQPKNALRSAIQMSNNEWLSASKTLAMAIVLPELRTGLSAQDSRDASEALIALYNTDPLGCSNWDIIINGFFKIGDMDNWMGYIERFVETAHQVYHQDKKLLNSLKYSLKQFHN
ncbi:MAG: glycosyltransferase family 1 protein [Fibrobacteria bacterium]|nr:glycosyltransferase family 1 protein [Fibrobacteria bacterium]